MLKNTQKGGWGGGVLRLNGRRQSEGGGSGPPEVTTSPTCGHQTSTREPEGGSQEPFFNFSTFAWDYLITSVIGTAWWESSEDAANRWKE